MQQGELGGSWGGQEAQWLCSPLVKRWTQFKKGSLLDFCVSHLVLTVFPPMSFQNSLNNYHVDLPSLKMYWLLRFSKRCDVLENVLRKSNCLPCSSPNSAFLSLTNKKIGKESGSLIRPPFKIPVNSLRTSLFKVFLDRSHGLNPWLQAICDLVTRWSLPCPHPRPKGHKFFNIFLWLFITVLCK